MIEIISHNAPGLSLRIVYQERDIRLDVGSVVKVNDLLIESLEGLLLRFGIAQGIDSWVRLNRLSILSFTENKLVGVSLFDLTEAAADYDSHGIDISEAVRRFSKSKKIEAKPIGKCPHDSRKSLYRLFDILQDYENYSGISPSEKRRILATLQTKERPPKK